MSKKYKNKSISELISENLNRPFENSDTSSDGEETPKVSHLDEGDYDLENEESIKTLSEIRKRNAKLLSEQSKKYSGEIASRKDYELSDNDDVENNSQASAGEDFEMMEEVENYSDREDTNQASNSEEESDAYEESTDCYSSNDDEELPENELVSIKNHANEVEKGICVQNQLSIWEKFLEIRIHSQKILNKANCFPNPVDFNKLCAKNLEFKVTSQNVKNDTEALLEKLIETQATLASQFTEIKNIGLSTRKRSNSRSTNEDNEYPNSTSKKFAPIIEENFEKFRPYRNAVLLKWEDRTKLLAPSSGGTKKKQLNDEFDIVKKIDNILMKREELISKSQKVKGTYKIFALNETDEELENKGEGGEISSPNIYDDTDFYHSQLRELIEFKSNISSDAYDVTKQFAELQKLRQKMKKKVDTRASKGRKIRYVVHKKLVNFMAPNDTSNWTDESKNELFRSLFVT